MVSGYSSLEPSCFTKNKAFFQSALNFLSLQPHAHQGRPVWLCWCLCWKFPHFRASHNQSEAAACGFRVGHPGAWAAGYQSRDSTEFSNCLVTGKRLGKEGKMERASSAILMTPILVWAACADVRGCPFRVGVGRPLIFFLVTSSPEFPACVIFIIRKTPKQPRCIARQGLYFHTRPNWLRSRSRAQGWSPKAPLPSQNPGARVHSEQGPSSGPCPG